jgi:uracil-DNA glycosylase
MSQNDKTDQLKVIRDEVWNLTESPLYTYRKQNKYYPVLGEGNHSADIIFIGEAPGKTEAETGRPFCGAAGRLLDELLQSIQLDRKDVYITNIVKDRPPENRDPSPSEIALYAPFLTRQIDIIQPKIIATLGRFSMQFILEKFNLPEKTQSITKLHGQKLVAKAAYGEITIIPFYHPAVALYNVNSKQILFEDFKILEK